MKKREPARDEARDKALARRRAIEIAVFQAWHDLGEARGRPKNQLAFSQFCIELDLIEVRDGTGPYLNLRRLNRLLDREMRDATIVAARKALKQGKPD